MTDVNDNTAWAGTLARPSACRSCTRIGGRHALPPRRGEGYGYRKPVGWGTLARYQPLLITLGDFLGPSSRHPIAEVHHIEACQIAYDELPTVLLAS